MSKRQPRGLAGGEELRTGCSGVPLAVAPDLYRMVLVNRQPPKKSARELGLSVEVAGRMLMLMRKHGIPSADRRIVLSLGYPDRTAAEIAAAFHVTVDYVNDCATRMSSIRRAEPLSTEMWEDITPETLTQDEILSRAAKIRERNELEQGQVPGSAGGRSQGGEGLGGDGQGQRRRRGPRHEARPSRSQPEERLLPHPGRSRVRSA